MANPEKKTWIEKFMEKSKKVDKLGIVGGLAMIAFGLIRINSALFTTGAVIAGGSVVTLWGAEKIRKWAEKRRLKKQATVCQS